MKTSLHQPSHTLNMHLRSVLNLVLLLGYAVQAVPQLGDLRSAFVVPPQPARGSCNSEDHDQLRTGFREAIDAIRQAVQAIDNLKSSAPEPLLHRKERRTWKRQAQLLKALFNIEVNNKLAADDKDAKSVRGKRW